jgi:uncharacterized protein YdhG (YjbR/CyaY superfamily)
MPAKGPASVPAYIAAQPAKVQRALKKMRAAIRKALPDAEEVISYRMPAYKLDESVVVYFAGWKEHVALYPGDAATVAAFKGELQPYVRSKGTIRFPLDEELPVKLIARIAKHRAGLVAASRKAKADARKKR